MWMSRVEAVRNTVGEGPSHRRPGGMAPLTRQHVTLAQSDSDVDHDSSTKLFVFDEAGAVLSVGALTKSEPTAKWPLH